MADVLFRTLAVMKGPENMKVAIHGMDPVRAKLAGEKFLPAPENQNFTSFKSMYLTFGFEHWCTDFQMAKFSPVCDACL